ncbi:hypothetical protein [Microbacterium sp. ZXX196]|uniref:hypothetical protein n=1 Tax=Microbacterium sp. ZXX196 TaxID=2609291 RepID=UPI0012B7A372|nr:hypothetical protein [Microbacterium sp. ZXX196]MTE22736.1 hypothetical protein [Microbacterium sp. ZXX196]
MTASHSDAALGTDAPPAGASPLLLPPGARLLHIGLPKTGTTALQRTAVRLRGRLASSGVVYPRTLTKRHDHLLPAAALMNKKVADTSGVPGREHWEDLRRRVEEAEDARVWVSHEWISECDDDQARRFRDELGPQLHAVVSVRQFGTIVTSTWQEFLKSTMLHDFETWIRYILTDDEAPDAHTRWQVDAFRRRASQGEVVARWARVLGPENVTVVVVDPAHRSQLTDAFEDMLGLPRTMLQAEERGSVSNRSMTVDEASVMLALNREYDRPNTALERRRGRLPIDLPHALLNRTPGEDERRLLLPRWAAQIADARGAAHADEIEASGVRVVGDLAALRAPSRFTEDDGHNVAARVPVDLAVRAAIGLAADARQHGEAALREQAASRADATPEHPRSLDDASGRELVAGAARRLADRARRLAGGARRRLRRHG